MKEIGPFSYRIDEAGLILVEDLKATHPIEGLVKGWHFRVLERSPGCHIAWAIDARGRTESANSTTAEYALEACVHSVNVRLRDARLRRRERLAREAASDGG